MGCGFGNNSRLQGENLQSQLPINTYIYSIGGNKLEEEISKAKSFVVSVEELRHAIIDELDQISILTGNCSNAIYGLNLKYCIISLAWKIATDNKGNYTKALLTHHPDKEIKITFGGKNNSKDALETSDYLFSYYGRLEKLTERIFETYKLKDEISNIIDRFEKEKHENIKNKEIFSQLTNNSFNTKKAFVIIDELKIKVKELLQEGKEGIEYIIDPRNEEEFNKIGLVNLKNQIKIPHIIVWKHLNPNERVSQPNDGYYKINELIVKKKKKKTEYKNNIIK